MPRPKNSRIIGKQPDHSVFKPAGIPISSLESVTLELDELEALRLCDLHGKYHDDAASEMNTTRQTLGRILESARRKVALALIEGYALQLGNQADLPNRLREFQCLNCQHTWTEIYGTGHPGRCPGCASMKLIRIDGGKKHGYGYGRKKRGDADNQKQPPMEGNPNAGMGRRRGRKGG
jgi:uncharacterized protein